MIFGGPYWNIKDYLPYQRAFNFINSERTIGKTYTTQGFLIERALRKGEEFIYLVRTQDEKKSGVMGKAFQKVILEQYSNYTFSFTNDLMMWDQEEQEAKVVCGHCVALTEVNKLKKVNFANVKWIVFDEYIIDERGKTYYVDGWEEPTLLLKLYHTIDRERDYVICFMLANSISFYNPYHLHDAFAIPHVPKNQIWTSENVLYHWTEATQELKEKKSKSKFLKMIEGTSYGDYAVNGTFIHDKDSFIGKRPAKAKYITTVIYKGRSFAIWSGGDGFVYVDGAVDPGCKLVISTTVYDHSEGKIMVAKNSSVIKWIKTCFKRGYFRYADMEIKARFEEFIVWCM